MENMPTYNNSEGIVVLLNNLAEIQDRVAYSDDMHFAILEDLDGVSLERLDPFRPSTDLTNWHSASAAQGYATPGYLNSQATGGIIADEQITIEPSTFSPDNDGYQDVVTILYSDDTPGLTANIYIFDSNGRQIKHLTKNELLGTNNSISWNGTTEDNALAPIGIYIIYIEVFSTDGNTQSFKKTCVLAHKLD
jgi:gliding motility-associated-like protein